MTEPGSVAPAAPGWWVRTNRVGTNKNGYNWAVTATGGRLSQGSASGAYGWTGSAVGTKPVQFIGATAATGSAITIPAHQVDDLLLIYAHYADTTQPPDKPAPGGTVPDWNYIDHNTGANFNASTTAWFKATSSTTTSGTWSPVHTMIAVVLREQDATNPIGGHAESGGASLNGATAPAVTMLNTSGGSMLLHFYGRHTTTGSTAWSTAPVGYTRRATVEVTQFNHGVCLNTKDDSTSDGSITQDSNSSESQGYRGATVEILS